MGPVYYFHDDNGHTGLVDQKGKVIAPAVYTTIERFHSHYRYSYGNPSIAPSPEDQKNDEFFVIKKGDLAGVIDASGKVIIPPKFEDIESFHNGHAVIRSKGLYGIADSNGDIVIEPRFDDITAFDELIAVKENGVPRLIDSKGATVNGVPFQGVPTGISDPWLSDGLAPVMIDGKFGFINAKGIVVIKPQFDWTVAFKDGFAPVWDKSGFWRFIDTTGNFVSPPFATVSSFAGGSSAVTIPGPLYTFTDAKKIDDDNEAMKRSIENIKGKK